MPDETLSEADERDLQDLSNEIAGAMQSDFQPRCVAAAFRRRPGQLYVFTMQVWIDLDAVQSPLLRLEPLLTPEDLEAALAAFGFEGEIRASAEDAVAAAGRMLEEVRDGFSMALPMAPTERSHDAEKEQDGFGDWLPLLGALISQVGLRRIEALKTPVGQAFALLAVDRRNKGWRENGEPYAVRGMDQVTEEDTANG